MKLHSRCNYNFDDPAILTDDELGAVKSMVAVATVSDNRPGKALPANATVLDLGNDVRIPTPAEPLRGCYNFEVVVSGTGFQRFPEVVSETAESFSETAAIPSATPRNSFGARCTQSGSGSAW